MIVYGDHPEEVGTDMHLRTLAGLHRVVAAQSSGIARHAALATLFVEIGRLIQGVADARFEAAGEDGPDDYVDRLMAYAAVLGRLLIQSWDSDFADVGTVPGPPPLLDTPGTLTLKQPEGYAFYALYPESYGVAARRLQLSGPPFVIGIRSIGTALSALVAAALDAPTPFTVRPVGHPFDRRLSVAPSAVPKLIMPGFHYVVVDEGPGLSGSSFAAVAHFLEAHGVPRARTAFLPSHAGEPGSEASDVCREVWKDVQRAAPSNDMLADRLARWVETIVGSLEAPLQPISGGGWRQVIGQDDWPADTGREPLKFLARAADGRYLLKFAGVGALGLRKMERAELLAEAGLIPAPLGLAYGFIVQQWVEAHPGAAPTVAQVAHYLATRRRVLPLPPQRGASLPALFEMARANIAEVLGRAARSRFEQGFPPTGLHASPMAIDGRMDRIEWLTLADSRVLKADAIDHDSDHDLIGPQDVAWDVVGAVVELGLNEAALVAALAGAGVPLDERLLRFLTPCYLAYRIGHSDRAAASAASDCERARHAARLTDYLQRLRILLGDHLVARRFRQRP